MIRNEWSESAEKNIRRVWRNIAEDQNDKNPIESNSEEDLPFTISYRLPVQTSNRFDGFRFAGKNFSLQNFVSRYRQTGSLVTFVLMEGDRRDCEKFGIHIEITASDESERTVMYSKYVLQPTPITNGQQVGSAQERVILTNWNTKIFNCSELGVESM